MKNFIIHDDWKIIERGWEPENRLVSESIFSVGNGYMGVRGNFGEDFTGPRLSGSYLAGIYYPDKTRVGWWKNGYPEYFAKVPNSVRWIGINISLDDQVVDLHTAEVIEHEMMLHMDTGILNRRTTLEVATKGRITIQSERFCHMAEKESAFQRYQVTSDSFSGSIKLKGDLDFNVRNSDANYDENFWHQLGEGTEKSFQWVAAKTEKTNFTVTAGMLCRFSIDGEQLEAKKIRNSNLVAEEIKINITPGQTVELEKHICIAQSMYVQPDEMKEFIGKQLNADLENKYNKAKKSHSAYWQEKWAESDIVIEGDAGAQQGIRYNIFQLHQTYTGEDSRLNIGPKGLTGEKYGGSTYWDTEAYCLPFYLSTAPAHVAKNLLIYRYNHLEKAIENAKKLGFNSGAALYPMVTMNGEECHNEWEITFEEIHRNGAMAYAIYNYIEYTGDRNYLLTHGLEVLVAISRFWAQRVNYSENKNAYVMLGVTGPNEYENNVNNNWYTNYLAKWTLEFTMDAIKEVQEKDQKAYQNVANKINFSSSEMSTWKEIANGMYFPSDEERGIFLQQDGFLDKNITQVKDLPLSERPICQKWSWDRILRSCFIKQADVLQGMYLFEDRFSKEEIERNFDFYEPLTVHESSLSPSVHGILAAALGKTEKAYEMYLRTARLDLDDYNNDTEDGLHTTSMAGTWMTLIQGFGGMRVRKNVLHFNPHIPEQWKGLMFHIRFRENRLSIHIDQNQITIKNKYGPEIQIHVFDKQHLIPFQNQITFANEFTSVTSN